MKKAIHSLPFTLFLTFCAAAQSKRYDICVQRADSFYQAGRYQQSSYVYQEAFIAYRGNALPNDRYNAACSWAMAGEPDSALHHLEILVCKDRYPAHFRISAEAAFESLHVYKRWKDLLDTSIAISTAAKVKIAKMENRYEPELAMKLDSVRKADQIYRLQAREAEKLYGWNSKPVKALWVKIKYQDSINLATVKQILDTRGWLGPDVVGPGSGAMFLVIQHSDLNTQLHYLPMMKEAAKNGKLEKGSLAMLEDRILMRQHKKQIYGTQIKQDTITGKYYVAPLSDPDNVDQRRAEVGMGPIADYVSHWDIIWNPEAYKREMAERGY